MPKRVQLKFGGQLKFDVIFIDACYDRIVDELMCPVETFALEENLKIIREALTKNGSFSSQFLQFVQSMNCSLVFHRFYFWKSEKTYLTTLTNHPFYRSNPSTCISRDMQTWRFKVYLMIFKKLDLFHILMLPLHRFSQYRI